MSRRREEAVSGERERQREEATGPVFEPRRANGAVTARSRMATWPTFRRVMVALWDSGAQKIVV